VSYYGSGRGDYYKGDYYGYRAGGIFGTIGKFLGGVAKTVLPAIIPGGGLIRTAVGGILSRQRQGAGVVESVAPALPFIGPAVGGRMLPVLRSLNPRQGTAIAPARGPFEDVVGGGSSTAPGYMVMGARKHRMNVANPKALRRALRRVAGFGKLARRAKRDIARAASAIGVRRGGGSSRGVITRSEAAKALRR